MAHHPPPPPQQQQGEEGDAWEVAKGRSSRRRKQQQACSGPPASAGIATQHAVPSQQLPGWGDVQSSGFTYTRSSNSSSNSKHRRAGAAAASPEQQAAALAQRVRGIAAELRGSAMFAALTAAMQQAVAAAAGACSCAADPGPCVAAQQENQLAHTSDQQQQVQEQERQQQPAAAPGATPSSSSSRQCCCWDWAAVQQLVVYGLGSPDDSKVSRHQLALVLLLQELLPGLRAPPQLYDPAFTDADARLLAALQLEVVGSNEEGRRSVGGTPTLFYLPHCEGALCDNLLAANWSGAALARLAILGNSFATYAERWARPEGSRPRGTRPPAKLLALVDAGVVRELPVPDGRYCLASAFNDMSLHVFAGSLPGEVAAED